MAAASHSLQFYFRILPTGFLAAKQVSLFFIFFYFSIAVEYQDGRSKVSNE